MLRGRRIQDILHTHFILILDLAPLQKNGISAALSKGGLVDTFDSGNINDVLEGSLHAEERQRNANNAIQDIQKAKKALANRF